MVRQDGEVTKQVGEETKKVQEKTKPVEVKTTPVEVKTAPVEEKTAPVEEKTTPVKEVVKHMEHGPKQVEERTKQFEEEVTSVSSPPLQLETATPQGPLQPAQSKEAEAKKQVGIEKVSQQPENNPRLVEPGDGGCLDVMSTCLTRPFSGLKSILPTSSKGKKGNTKGGS